MIRRWILRSLNGTCDVMLAAVFSRRVRHGAWVNVMSVFVDGGADGSDFGEQDDFTGLEFADPAMRLTELFVQGHVCGRRGRHRDFLLTTCGRYLLMAALPGLRHD